MTGLHPARLGITIWSEGARKPDRSRRLLPGESLASIANWADCVKGTYCGPQTPEMVAYVVAFTILVVAGMFLRTIILNFFVGPLIVVASVAVVTPLLSRRRPP